MQHPFCQPREHLLSRRQLLGRSGTALAAGLGVGALGGLVQPLVAEELQKKQRQVLFIWIDGGMRGGVPKFLHDYTVTYYGPLRSYFKSLDISDKGDCYMYVLDSQGIVVDRFNGYSTEENLKKMYSLIDSLNE